MTAFYCKYPILFYRNMCCNTKPCAIVWFRPCSLYKGCYNLGACLGCDAPLSKDDLVYKALLEKGLIIEDKP